MIGNKRNPLGSIHDSFPLIWLQESLWWPILWTLLIIYSKSCPTSQSLWNHVTKNPNLGEISLTFLRLENALETYVLFRCSLLINVGFCQVLWCINTPISVRNWKWKSGENLEFTKKNLWPAQIYTRDNCPNNENLLVHS